MIQLSGHRQNGREAGAGVGREEKVPEGKRGNWEWK